MIEINVTKRHYGWIPDLPDHRDSYLTVIPPKTMPPQVDLRQLGTVPIHDQGFLNSCTVSAIASAIDYERLRLNMPLFHPSRLFIYYNGRVLAGNAKCDTGMGIRDGIKSIVKLGACSEVSTTTVKKRKLIWFNNCKEHSNVWPYDIEKFDKIPPRECYKSALKHVEIKYQRLNQLLYEFRNCLAVGYTFIGGISIYQSFERAMVTQSGIVQMPEKKERMIGGQAVLFVGYDDIKKRFLVRNNWGANWGMEGFFWLPYEYATNPFLALDFWNIQVVKS